MNSKKFGLFIRERRKATDRSQKVFAKLVGISVPYLSLIEHGYRIPIKEKIVKMAYWLHVPEEELLGKIEG